MKYHEWQQERDQDLAEAKLELTEALEGYPAEIKMEAMADYLNDLARESVNETYSPEEDEA